MKSPNATPAYYFTYKHKECKTAVRDTGKTDADDSWETSRRLKIFYYLALCNKVVGLILITLIVIWILQYRGGFMSYNFHWHPLFMVFGMLVIHSKGMLFYRTERTIGIPRLKLMYARLMIGGLIFIITGLIAGIEPNNSAQSVESYTCITCMCTLHNSVGLTSVILFFIQCIADFYSYLNSDRNQHSNTTYTQWYSYLILGSFIGAIAACFLGFNEMSSIIENDGSHYKSEETILWFIYSTLFIFGGVSVYLFSHDTFKRLARPEDSDILSKEAVFKHLFCIPWSFHECTYSLRMLFSRNHSPPPSVTDDTEIYNNH